MQTVRAIDMIVPKHVAQKRSPKCTVVFCAAEGNETVSLIAIAPLDKA